MFGYTNWNLITGSDIMFDHNVKLAGHFQKFGRTMSDDRLLFPALVYVYKTLDKTMLKVVIKEQH